MFSCLFMFFVCLHWYLHIWCNTSFIQFFDLSFLRESYSQRCIYGVLWAGHFGFDSGCLQQCNLHGIFFSCKQHQQCLRVPLQFRMQLLVEAVVKSGWGQGHQVGQSSGPVAGPECLSLDPMVVYAGTSVSRSRKTNFGPPGSLLRCQ